MRTLLILVSICFLSSSVSGQDEPLKGAYGFNDMRIRAGSGLIEEGRLRKFNFETSGLTNIAVLYWPEKSFGQQKIGITIFENTDQDYKLDSGLIITNNEVVRQYFEAVQNVKFHMIALPPQVSTYFTRKPITSQVKVLDPGTEFLHSLKDQGFDGLFILYEHSFQDLISGSKEWLPSKGLFKYFKKELVYYGLYSTLIDLNSLTIVKNIGYKQLSADYSPIRFKEVPSLSDEQKTKLREELAKRFENNIQEIIRVHKLE